MKLYPLKHIVLTIENLASDGDGVGYIDGRKVHVAGVLPGEVVEVIPYKKRKSIIYAHAKRVIKTSPERLKPKEYYYQRTGSPWQCIPYNKQLQYKKDIVLDMWKSIVGIFPNEDVAITGSSVEWAYRNKLEFSFNEHGLAFHIRGRRYEMQSVEGCVLGSDTMNMCVANIVAYIRRNRIPFTVFKSLIIRYSFSEDVCIAIAYVTCKDIIIKIPTGEKLVGFHVVYSNPLSPASVTTDVLFSSGRKYLTEQIGDNNFYYHYNSFFQVNPAMFTVLLADVRRTIIPGGERAVDIYAGVGTIGISLSDLFKQIQFVEVDTHAQIMIEKNINALRRTNLTKTENIIIGEAEKQNLHAMLSNSDTVIVDPPRNGLHPRVLNQIVEAYPKQIIYVSCNPKTQARDWIRLRSKYDTLHWQLYDFYPQTPHVESLLVLSRI